MLVSTVKYDIYVFTYCNFDCLRIKLIGATDSSMLGNTFLAGSADSLHGAVNKEEEYIDNLG